MYEFDPDEKLVRTWALLTRGQCSVQLSMAVDTGCSQTVLAEAAITTLTYDGPGTPVTIVTGGGAITGSVLTVDKFSALGREVEHYEVQVCDLPAALGVDGLLGLDFFKGKLLTFDFANGYLRLDDPEWPPLPSS